MHLGGGLPIAGRAGKRRRGAAECIRMRVCPDAVRRRQSRSELARDGWHRSVGDGAGQTEGIERAQPIRPLRAEAA